MPTNDCNTALQGRRNRRQTVDEIARCMAQAIGSLISSLTVTKTMHRSGPYGLYFYHLLIAEGIFSGGENIKIGQIIDDIPHSLPMRLDLLRVVILDAYSSGESEKPAIMILTSLKRLNVVEFLLV